MVTQKRNMVLLPEHLRIIDNTEQFYSAWLEAKRERRLFPASMYWKDVGTRTYLYHTPVTGGSPTSLGPRCEETELVLQAYQLKTSQINERLTGAATKLEMALAQYGALKLPKLMDLPGQILREMDLQGHLGTNLLVVGTNAFPAYEIAAGERFASGLDETEDFDVTWCRGALPGQLEVDVVGSPLMSVLKSVDSSFTMSKRAPYQALNSQAYEVEMLAAPSVQKTLTPQEVFRPAAMPEQEWLLLGKPIRHVVCTQSGAPAPLVVPDPRWMGLHKLWLSQKETRKATKRPKDKLQGELLLDAVARNMQQSYPMNVDFVLSLPDDLLPVFNEWASQYGFVPQADQPAPSWA
jgi:hypothetical protein